jgi:hypothetical protein
MTLWYKNERRNLPVYEIDLDYLIYNQYNGRIATAVKSFEKENNRILDASDEEDKNTISDFLWYSKENSNKSTLASLREQGQLKYGIVTSDGVIIDGNRRAMLLNRLHKDSKPAYFSAVILDETIDSNPKEIMRLETTYQMGEDAKVDYNAIEKYLKCKDLKSYGFSEKDIGKMMGEKESQVKKYLSIMNLMDDYLGKLGYDNIYTRLDKTEGIFFDLQGYLQRYEGNNSRMVKWKYDDSDINELKLIYFDYIRATYNRSSSSSSDSGDSKDYRFIGQTSKKGSFFANEDVWNEFRDQHFGAVDPIRKEEPSVEHMKKERPDLKLSSLTKKKDEWFANKADSALKRNLGLGKEALDNENKSNEPLELLRAAAKKLEAINTESSAFLDDEAVYLLVDSLRKMTEQYKRIIQKK